MLTGQRWPIVWPETPTVRARMQIFSKSRAAARRLKQKEATGRIKQGRIWNQDNGKQWWNAQNLLARIICFSRSSPLLRYLHSGQPRWSGQNRCISHLLNNKRALKLIPGKTVTHPPCLRKKSRSSVNRSMMWIYGFIKNSSQKGFRPISRTIWQYFTENSIPTRQMSSSTPSRQSCLPIWLNKQQAHLPAFGKWDKSIWSIAAKGFNWKSKHWPVMFA